MREKIIVLRRRGLTNRQIAERLGTSLEYVAQVCIKLLREGLIERREGRKPRDPAVAKRNERIAKLHEKGMSSSAIATKLGIRRDLVYSALSVLRATGRLPKPGAPRRGRKKAAKAKARA